ncbi:MAG: histidine phosphatase family protein [Planctomycetaceae bacterium]|nr:histidine phosphatase family protein [Planctomycetaceae bacterium]
MDLYILRHAWAVDRDQVQDDLRPLSADGRKRFAAVAKRLVTGGAAPKRIATSPLVRCVETANLLADALGGAEIVELDGLRPGGDAKTLWRWTVEQSRQCDEIAWVGHAPDVELWTAALIGDASGSIRLAKGATAAVRFDDATELGKGQLQWLATAKLLGV